MYKTVQLAEKIIIRLPKSFTIERIEHTQAYSVNLNTVITRLLLAVLQVSVEQLGKLGTHVQMNALRVVI